MRKFIAATLFSVFSSLAMVASPSAAQMETPEGIWELEFRDSHFEVELCEGDKLCATLIWLSEGASTPEKTVYLNTMLIDHATRIMTRTWKGRMSLFGQEAKGKVTQVSDDVMELRGCVLEVLCQTYELYRVK